MINQIGLSLVLFLSASVMAPVRAEEKPEVIAEIDRSQIYEGESLVYRVTLNHVKNPTPPILEGFEKDFDVENAGERSLNSSQTFNLNGKITRIERYGRAYYYRLTPKKTGTLNIPAPRAVVDGETLQGRPFTLKVLSPDDQDVAVLEIESDHQNVYPLQPFTVTLTVFIKELPDPYLDESPLSVQRDSPALSIPWVADLPTGLVPAKGWREWLEPIERRSSFFQRGKGFTINKIASFFPTDPAIYLPDARRVSRPGEDGKTQGYWSYKITRTFIPNRTGTYRFGPATLKGTFATGINQKERRLEGTDIYAVGRSIHVIVKDAPEEGRPDSYTGAMGTFEFEGDLKPSRARVGDPMTLTLTLKGRGTLDRARAPDLEAIPGIKDHFKIYEATEETKGHSRTFTYSLRPLRAGNDTFPSVPFSYFDVERERFATLNTEPIPLTIEKGDQLDEGEIVAQPGSGRQPGAAIEARKEGIFANITDLGALRNEGVRPAIFAALLGGMGLFYLLISAATHRRRRLTGDQALQRRKSAQGKARNRMREGASKIRTGEVREGTEAARSALVGLVADAADLPEAGLTIRDVRDRLGDLGVEKVTVDRAAGLLDAFDAAQFGARSGEGGAEQLAGECEEVVDALIESLKKQGRLR